MFRKFNHKRAVAMMLVLVMAVSFFSSAVSATTGQTCSSVKITRNGQVVDTFNGVQAAYTTKSSNSGTYSCARLVSNYYSKVYGISISNMFSGKTPSASGGCKVKTVSGAPKVGDIYYQTGHWAIVKQVTQNGNGYKVVLLEQNWKWKSGGATYAAKNRTIDTRTYGHGLKFFRVYRSNGSSVN